MNLALLVLRVVVGVLFIGHGAQKLFGWFGGAGPKGTGQFFEGLGMKPGKTMAVMAGGGELVGGALCALGLLTPLAAALLSAVMMVAIWTVHRSNGLWVSAGGFEYNLVLLATLFAVTATGAGDWSLDGLWSLDLAGEGWALAELAAAIIGAGVAVSFGRFAARHAHPHDGAVAVGS
jgi:putative oxidoreductase